MIESYEGVRFELLLYIQEPSTLEIDQTFHGLSVLINAAMGQGGIADETVRREVDEHLRRVMELLGGTLPVADLLKISAHTYDDWERYTSDMIVHGEARLLVA